MRYLSVEEILALHDYQIARFGGSGGLINLPLLESAVGRPMASFSGVDLYKDVFAKAAVLLYSIIKNHPFVDGNKRTGIHAVLTFLKLNDVDISISSSDLVNLGIQVAKGDLSFEEIAKYLMDNSI
jgi:death-on-curing protein